MPSAPRDGSLSPPTLSRNVAVTSFGYLLPLLAALATAPILAQQLGVVGRGELAAATAPFLLVATSATLGVPEALTYSIARGGVDPRALLGRAAGLLLIGGIGSGALLILLAPWFSDGSSDVRRVIVLSTLAVVPALCVGGLRGAASGLHLWNRVTLERTVSAGVRLVGVVVLAVLGRLDLGTAALVIVLAPILGGVSYLGLGRHLTTVSPVDPHGGQPTQGLASYGMRVWVGSLSGILLLRLDQTIIAPLSNSYELGLYAVAVSISEVPLIITAAVRNVIFAADSSDPNDTRLATSARLSTAASAALGLTLAAALPLALPILFGTEFLPAIGVTLVLLLAVVAGTPGSLAGSGLSSRGRPGLRSTSLVIACLVNVVLLLLLVPRWGALGAAVATLVGNLVSSNLNILWLHRYFRVSPWPFFGLHRRDLRVVDGALRQMLRGSGGR